MLRWFLLSWAIFLPVSLADLAFFQFSPTSLLLEASLAALLSSLILVVQSRQERPIMLFALLYMILFYLVPGLLHVNKGAFPFFNMSYQPGHTITAALVVLIFSIMFWIGYVRAPLFRSLSMHGASEPFTPISRIFTIVFLCALALMAGAAAGFDVLNTRRGDVGNLAIDIDVMTLMAQTVARVSAFLALLYAAHRLYIRFSVANMCLVALAAGCYVLINNPLALARYVQGAFVITTLICFLRFTRPVKIALVCAVVVAQVTLFPAFDSLSRGSGEIDLRPIEYLSTHGDFDGFQSTINVVKWVEDEGVRVGNQLASALLFFVPRSAWSGKSPGTGLEAADHMGYPFLNISAPMPSELFADFHIPGLVILSFLLGNLLRLGDMSVEDGRRRKSLDMHLLLPAIVAGYMFIILRGSLVSVVGPLAVSIFVALAVGRLERFFGLFERSAVGTKKKAAFAMR